ncbi:REP-associated tyrosine transposase [Pseudoxanthomonas mexicana]|uniref:REP-associated tyrosine transposase n=1 Tax=Pseudoxanthomonas mexicana TaxID=128785 RepID=UPI00398BB2C0
MTTPRLTIGRISEREAIYAVTTVIASRKPLLLETGLAGHVAAEIDRCEEEGRIRSLAWVVMPDHLHWVLVLREGTLSRCLQAFKSRSACAINNASGRVGRIWQAGFYDHRLRGHEDLRAQIRYLVANPVRSGLVEQIEDYPHWWCEWIRDSADL